MLKFDNVSFSYGNTLVLDNFSFEIKKGECAALFGKSGCGKTTVTRLILGLEKADSGQIKNSANVSCVFQEDRLLPHLDVVKNICINPSKTDFALCNRLIKLFGLSGYEHAKIGELSGGMRRRVAIIRAICFEADLLILDEALNGIDEQNKKIIAKFLKDEYVSSGKSILMISHVKEDLELMDAKIINMKSL